jgi:hypothetical protein
MAGRTGAARITAGSLDLGSTIRGWELHLRAGGRSPATLRGCRGAGASKAFWIYTSCAHTRATSTAR